MRSHFNTIIIGSGQGGVPLARDLANQGWKVALIERGNLGGSCINYGCTPTKTLVASAKVAHTISNSDEFGVHVSSRNLNFSEVIARKSKIVERFRTGIQSSIESTDNLTLFRADASFNSANEVVVTSESGDDTIISGEKIIINTGGRPFVPPIAGIENVDYLDSTSIMELESLPEQLVILGGGYIGLEFGQMFKRFGSDVTIIERSDQILSREDSDVSEALTEVLERESVQVITNADVKHVVQRDKYQVELEIESNGKRAKISGSHLLIATGRTPNTDTLNLDKAGVRTDNRGYIPVNERLETDVAHIYAIGDVNGGPAFTHVSYDDYRILNQNFIGKGGATTDGRLIPYTVFTDPQLGRVGLSEKEASQKRIEFKVAKLPMSHVARGIETGSTDGFLKALIDPKSDQIIGCTALGAEGGEIMSMLQIAMMGKVPYTRLRDGIFAHPTYAESLNSLFGAIE